MSASRRSLMLLSQNMATSVLTQLGVINVFTANTALNQQPPRTGWTYRRREGSKAFAWSAIDPCSPRGSSPVCIGPVRTGFGGRGANT